MRPADTRKTKLRSPGTPIKPRPDPGGNPLAALVLLGDRRGAADVSGSSPSPVSRRTRRPHRLHSPGSGAATGIRRGRWPLAPGSFDSARRAGASRSRKPVALARNLASASAPDLGAIADSLPRTLRICCDFSRLDSRIQAWSAASKRHGFAPRWGPCRRLWGRWPELRGSKTKSTRKISFSREKRPVRGTCPKIRWSSIAIFVKPVLR